MNYCKNQSIFINHLQNYNNNEENQHDLKFVILLAFSKLNDNLLLKELSIKDKQKKETLLDIFDKLNKYFTQHSLYENKFNEFITNLSNQTSIEIVEEYKDNETNQTYQNVVVTFEWLQEYNNLVKTILLTKLSELLNESSFPLESENIIYCQTSNLLDIASTHNRLKLDYYVMPNRKEYLDFLDYYIQKNNKHFKPYNHLFIKNHSETFYLFKQQKFVTNYLNDNTPYRGLLLYHGLGSGKSGASIATVEGFRNKKVVVMTPSSLQKNYETEIKTFGKISYKFQYHWCFQEIAIKNPNTISILESKGIPADLITNYEDKKNTIVIKKIFKKVQKIEGSKKSKKFMYGVWLIDITKKPNFNQLSKDDKKQITHTINLLINHKYTFIPYNSGRALFRRVFENLSSTKELDYINNNLLTTEDKKQVKKGDNIYNFHKQKIFNDIFDKQTNNLINPFDNKIVVIDEIHNLISMMTKTNTLNGPMLYESLMRAKNLTLICLSGTPFINSPFELTVLFNLLRGNIKSFGFQIKDINDNKTIKDIEDIFNKIIYLDRVEVIQGEQSNYYNLIITRLPTHFFRKFEYNESNVQQKWSGKIVKNTTLASLQTDEEFFSYLKTILLQSKLELQPTINYQNHSTFIPDLLLPDDINGSQKYKYIRYNENQVTKAKEEFFNLYVNDENKIKEKMSFYVRTMGLISFFCETTAKISKSFNYQSKKIVKQNVSKFPKVIYNKPIELPLTTYQLLHYVKRREKELFEDEMAKQKSKMKQFDDETQKSFRTHTRQISNFGFPPNVARKNNNDENIPQLKKITSNNLTPRNLLPKPSDFSIISLTELSLKYTEILNKILVSSGLVLCYSQYRTVEGLEILGRILSNIGFRKI